MRPGAWPLLLALATPLGAQQVPRFPAAMAGLTARDSSGASLAPEPVTRKPWLRPVASLIVPGSGQLMGGQARGIVYLAVEIWLVSRVIANDQRGDDQAAHYRQLAYDVARRPFVSNRVDGPFEYYETMEKFVESGVYDTDPGTAFQPEPDTATFNGSVWLLARRTYFANPDSLPAPTSPQYQAALTFYQSRAVGGEFQWSWRGARLEQDVFRGSIRASDAAYQQKTNYLGALVLNHLASAIDAMVSARMGHHPAALPRAGFQAGPDRASLVWTGTFRSPKL
jgi:hypothetical protein